MRLLTKSVVGMGMLAAMLGGATTSFAESYAWNSVAFGGGGFVSGILTSKTQANLIYARTDVGGAYRWNEAGQSWIPLSDGVSDQQTSYMGVESFATDPQNPSKLYMYLGTSYWNLGLTAVARSNDYGATFQYTVVTSQFKASGNGSNRHTGEKLGVDPNKANILFLGTRYNGLFKSIDSGVTWNAVTSLAVSTTSNGNGISFVLFDKSSGTTGTATPKIYVGVQTTGGSNFYLSTDAGASWNPVASAPTTYMPERASLASDGKMYITYGDANNSAGAVYRFDTKASSNAWVDVSPQAGVAYGGVSVDASNPLHIVVSTFSQWQQQLWGSTSVWGDQIYQSTTGGSSWTNVFTTGKYTFGTNGFPWITNHALHWAGSLEIDPFNSNRVFVTSGNGLFSCSNLSSTSTTWNFMVKGLEETVPLNFISLPGGPFYSVVGDFDGEITSDLTTSPANGTHVKSIGTTSAMAFGWLKPATLARGNSTYNSNNVVNGSIVYYSENTGSSWTPLALPSTEGMSDLALSADGSTLLWATASATVHRTTNKGSSWTTSTGLSFNAIPVADAKNSLKFYAYNKASGVFYVSLDGGASFNSTATLNSNGNSRARAVPGVEGDVWVALYGNGLTRTTNSGTSFTKVSTVSACSQVGFGKAATGNTYPAVYIWGTVSGVTGMFRSDNAGTSWTRINDDLHQYGGPGDNAKLIDGDMNTYGRVYMSTVGRGIIYGTYSAGASSSSSVSSSSMASSSSVVVSSSSVVASSSSKASSSSIAVSSSSVTLSSSIVVSSSSFAVSSSSVVASSSSKASSSSVAVSSSSSATTQIFTHNVTEIQLQATAYQVYNIMGHLQQVSAVLPNNLAQGRWIIVAIGLNGQRLSSFVSGKN